MVEFLTFFLGILVGVHPVGLDISGPVAEVEILLDDTTVQVLTQAPWTFECDFGYTPEPHKLVAIARDNRGVELDSATQWINLGHQSVEAQIILHRDAKGHPRTASVDWVGVGSGVPESVEVSFDGVPLDVSDLAEFDLPPYDDRDFHFLTANIRFRRRTVRALASFGAAFSSEVETELTAIPVQSDGKSVPKLHKLQQWFLKGNEPLEVHAVEKGPADIIVVWDSYAQTSIDSIRAYYRNELSLTRRGTRTGGADEFRGTARLGPNTRIAFMEAFPAPVKDTALEDELFVSSPRHLGEEGGLLWLMRHVSPAAGRAFRLADAVASAGVMVQADGRRRAVVLIMGDVADDRSRQHPIAIRAYLQQLRVPLYVWSVTSGAPHPEWGEVRYVGPPPSGQRRAANLIQAVKDLARDLDKQRVVWLEGTHLPQSIVLSDRAEGLHIAGVPTGAGIDKASHRGSQ